MASVNPNLSLSFTDIVNIALVQINFELIFDRSRNYIALADESTHIEKVRFILLELVKKVPYKVDLVVFPEYSASPNLLPIVQKIAKQQGILVVLGSYHEHSSGENICPIILPNGLIRYSRKRYISKTERYLVMPADSGGNELVWRTANNEYCLQVFLCSDYIGTALYPDISLDPAKVGIIVVPMCSSEWKDFYHLAAIHLRSDVGKFIALVNSCGEIARGQLRACGRSCLWASSPNGKSYKPFIGFGQIPGLSVDSEGIIICTLNLADPKFSEEKPTSISSVSSLPAVSGQMAFRLE